MKKLRTLTTLAFMLATSFAAVAQTLNDPTPFPTDTIGFVACSGADVAEIIGVTPWDGDDEIEQGGHKGPAYPQPLPEVTYDNMDNILTFTGVASLSTITYYIVGEANSLCLSNEVTLAMGEEETVSVAALQDGDYTLILRIGPRYYIGEFTIYREE